MRKYTLSVKDCEAPSYCDPLKFTMTTDKLDEVMNIVSLMLKNGHTVNVVSEDLEPEKPSKELVEAVATELAGRIGEKAPYEFPMDETGAAPLEALAG